MNSDLAHFARCHGELTMMDFAKPGDVAINRIVVGRISKNCRGAASLHEFRIAIFTSGIPRKINDGDRGPRDLRA